MTTTRRLLSSASNNAAAALAKQQQQPPPMLHKFLHTIDAGKKPPIGAGPGDSLKTSEEPNKSPAATAAAAKGSGGSGKVFGSILQRNFEKEEALMNDIPERQKHWSEEYIFLGDSWPIIASLLPQSGGKDEDDPPHNIKPGINDSWDFFETIDF